MAQEMPKVMDCTASDCAYNTDQECHAMAITVGEEPTHPVCDTYFHADIHGGVKEMTAGVGACKSSACSYNEAYECTASSIHVGKKGNEPDCLTFEAR